jgi:putative chitinase
MLDATQLRQIMPNVSAAKVAQFLPYLNSAMEEYGINSAARASAFLAQLAHESGEFRWMEEIWGPTTAQRRYEPVTELAKRLGNSRPGDGRRYKGRGPIQLTGRANYKRFGDLLGVDLVSQPERAAQPEVAFRIAALYWMSRGLNELADREDFREITRRINGGFNGLADRIKYFERAHDALANWVVERSREMAPAARDLLIEPLSRGYEAINELTKPARPRREPAKAPRRTKTAARAKTKRKPARKKVAKRKAVRKKVAKRASGAGKTAARGKVARPKKAKSSAVRKSSRGTARKETPTRRSRTSRSR